MTGEEMERAISFVLESQAQLTANVGKLSESVERLSVKVDRTHDSVIALLAIAEIHESEIKELGASVRAVDDRQRQSDERLNALINTVERIVGGRG